MGSHTFRWEQPAEEVFVTGPFDNWSHSVKLDKKDLVHEKTVAISDISHPLPYKYFVDGRWECDPTKKIEPDHEGNLNNVLYPDEVAPPNAMATQTISSVAPGSSTVQLAGQQPLENKSTDLPGAFPETPAAAADTGDDEKKDGILAGAAATGAAALAAVGSTAAYLTGSKKKEEGDEQTISVNPIPASEGTGNPVQLAPGEPVPAPSTINNNTVTSKVHDDPSLKSSTQDADQTVGVAPIPASGGIGNPVHLQPGEKVPDPSTITANTLTSNVKLDKESYEKSDSGAPQIPPVLSPQSEREAEGAAIFGLGPQTSNMIPESSIGMGKDAPAPLEGAAISSVGANSTTNQLAGQQPLEPRGVPQVVADSQKEAHVEPEAAANPTAVVEKKEVENELKAKVPEEQATSGNTGGITGAVTGGLAAAGAAVAGAAAVAREKTHETTGKDPVSVLPTSVQQSIDGINKQSDAAAGVPAEVKESQKEAHASPEAAANPEAVQEKKGVEQELLKKVPESQAQGEPAPTETAALSAVAPTTSSSGAPQLGDPTGGGLAPISMDEKTAGSSALNASADAPATTPATKVAAQADRAPQQSRDVSPMSKPVGGQQPTVTTGTDSAAVASTSTPVGTPRKNAPSTPTNKRHSLMGRLKGTPDSQKTTDSEGKKKKGFIARLKEKFKSCGRKAKRVVCCLSRDRRLSNVDHVTDLSVKLDDETKTESDDEPFERMATPAEWIYAAVRAGPVPSRPPYWSTQHQPSSSWDRRRMSTIPEDPPQLTLRFTKERDDWASLDGKGSWPVLVQIISRADLTQLTV